MKSLHKTAEQFNIWINFRENYNLVKLLRGYELLNFYTPHLLQLLFAPHPPFCNLTLIVLQRTLVPCIVTCVQVLLH